MKISRFFIDRPIFASVLSIVFIILGGVSFIRLPIAQYPEIARRSSMSAASIPAPMPEVVATTVSLRSRSRSTASRTCSTWSSNATATGASRSR
jgi:multidrug efflux pump subunit AcrB